MRPNFLRLLRAILAAMCLSCSQSKGVISTLDVQGRETYSAAISLVDSAHGVAVSIEGQPGQYPVEQVSSVYRALLEQVGLMSPNTVGLEDWNPDAPWMTIRPNRSSTWGDIYRVVEAVSKGPLGQRAFAIDGSALGVPQHIFICTPSWSVEGSNYAIGTIHYALLSNAPSETPPGIAVVRCVPPGGVYQVDQELGWEVVTEGREAMLEAAGREWEPGTPVIVQSNVKAGWALEFLSTLHGSSNFILPHLSEDVVIR